MNAGDIGYVCLEPKGFLNLILDSLTLSYLLMLLIVRMLGVDLICIERGAFAESSNPNCSRGCTNFD